MLPLQEALARESQPGYTALLSQTAGLIIAFYIFFGVVNYLAYGTGVETVLTVSLPQASYATTVRYGMLRSRARAVHSSPLFASLRFASLRFSYLLFASLRFSSLLLSSLLFSSLLCSSLLCSALLFSSLLFSPLSRRHHFAPRGAP